MKNCGIFLDFQKSPQGSDRQSKKDYFKLLNEHVELCPHAKY